MVVLSWIITGLSVVPGFRGLLRWLLERDMEVVIEPTTKPSLGKPTFSVNVLRNTEIYALFTVTFTNHRTDRKERVIECSVELKKRHWFFWRKTIGSVPVSVRASTFRHISRGPTSLDDLALEPQSSPAWVTLNATGTIDTVSLPRCMDLVVILRMVGPIRKIERLLTRVRHTPPAPHSQTDSNAP